MTTAVTFDVLGVPSPQGSKTRMPNGAMLDGRSKGARERHTNWRSAVADAARAAVDAYELDGPLDGPLVLVADFRFPMPTSRPKRIRETGTAYKTTAPDLDKLLRALCDSLKAGGLIRDDARIALVSAAKYEVTGWTGARVTITPLTSPDTAAMPAASPPGVTP